MTDLSIENLGNAIRRLFHQYEPYLRWGLGAYAVAHIAFVVFLFFNHNRFPLFLDLMEGTVLQHFQRAAAGQAIYPDPTPEYVPLAYNPLFYVISVPVSWLTGVNLPTLRGVAVAGTLLAGLILYLTIRRRTGSSWWSLVGLGLFAAAYRVMDAYLDTAHSDSWLLASALAGTYLIGLKRSRWCDLAGVLLLVLSFWFKQHGALFAIGGVAYLTWRDGGRAWPAWVVAAILGPVAYIWLGPFLFGPQFHYFTWEVPRRWSELNLKTFYIYGRFVATSYPLLALVAFLGLLRQVRRRDAKDVWLVQLGAAVASGFMGALDAGSSYNVFLPMGVWFILMGTCEMARLARSERWHPYGTTWFALAITLTLFIYDPRSVIASPRADETYAELIRFLKGLDGQVYAPTLGQLPSGYRLRPAAHWVALEDMVRGPGRDTGDQPIVRSLLAPAMCQDGDAYLLANGPLEWRRHFLGFLETRYELVDEFPKRFRPLRVLPGRWDHGWPRFLYKCKPAASNLKGSTVD